MPLGALWKAREGAAASGLAFTVHHSSDRQRYQIVSSLHGICNMKGKQGQQSEGGRSAVATLCSYALHHSEGQLEAPQGCFVRLVPSSLE